jgi:hypothetical protein
MRITCRASLLGPFGRERRLVYLHDGIDTSRREPSLIQQQDREANADPKKTNDAASGDTDREQMQNQIREECKDLAKHVEWRTRVLKTAQDIGPQRADRAAFSKELTAYLSDNRTIVDPAIADAVKEHAARLGEELGSPRFQVREQVQAELTGLVTAAYRALMPNDPIRGTKIDDALKPFVKSRDVEVAKRAEDILAYLKDKAPNEIAEQLAADPAALEHLIQDRARLGFDTAYLFRYQRALALKAVARKKSTQGVNVLKRLAEEGVSTGEPGEPGDTVRDSIREDALKAVELLPRDLGTPTVLNIIERNLAALREIDPKDPSATSKRSRLEYFLTYAASSLSQNGAFPAAELPRLLKVWRTSIEISSKMHKAVAVLLWKTLGLDTASVSGLSLPTVSETLRSALAKEVDGLRPLAENRGLPEGTRFDAIAMLTLGGTKEGVACLEKILGDETSGPLRRRVLSDALASTPEGAQLLEKASRGKFGEPVATDACSILGQSKTEPARAVVNRILADEKHPARSFFLSLHRE